MKPFKIKFAHDGEEYAGEIEPLPPLVAGEAHKSYRVTLNDFLFGIMYYDNNKWKIDSKQPREMVDKIGDYITQQTE